MDRNLFVLPRTHRVDKQGNETNIKVDMADVYTEFDSIRQAHKITTWMSKPVERKYAFELPGIPSSGDYMKVVYKYSRKYSWTYSIFAVDMACSMYHLNDILFPRL